MAAKTSEPLPEGIKHFLVPKHELLSKEDATAILTQYKITVNELPKIKITDPAIKHMPAKPGDVIKISRKSVSASETVFYRGVISE